MKWKVEDWLDDDLDIPIDPKKKLKIPVHLFTMKFETGTGTAERE